MTTISQLSAEVYQRLEEDPSNPVFWTQYEVYNALMEAMNEAALITGVVEATAQITLPVNANSVYMPEGVLVLPGSANALTMLRVQGPTPVQKTEWWTLDQIIPGWQNVGGTSASPPVTTIQYWFPIGLNQIGFYPQLSVTQTVNVAYLAYPVQDFPPTGAETVPFQVEFQESLTQYAAHVLRLKESGQEFEQSQVIYQEFLETMKRLAKFQLRHDSLVFSRSVGAPVRVLPVEVR